MQSVVGTVPLGTWEHNVRMDLRETGCGGLDWIILMQDTFPWQAVVNTVMNLWVQ